MLLLTAPTLFILLFAVMPRLILGVRITKIYVPLGASHEAPLECKYDMESDQLYDVKWYKDGQQFFRCLPSGETMEYVVDGIKIIHTNNVHMGSCSLTLMMLSKKSAGEYKCEVCAEGPAFKTAVNSGKMRIIESAKWIQTTTPTNKVVTQESQTNSTAENRLKASVILLYIIIVLSVKYIIY